MFELIFLGTSASAPSVHRGLSASVVTYKNYRFLVDCGEGTQRQVLRSGLGFKRLNRILLTHGHLDHILGLGGLISTFSRWEAVEQVEIYGGQWALQRVRDLIYGVVFVGGDKPIHVDLIPVESGTIMEDDTFRLSAFPVIHRGPGCYGFTFAEKARRPFLPEKAQALGVPHGPERRLLVQGQPITLDDGRVVHPEEVLGDLVPGTKLVYVGDAGHIDNLVEPASGADALVIESTYLETEAELAERFGHLTARQAAELAARAGVRRLYLTHLSRRYHEKDVYAEAAAVFPDVVVARDFLEARIKAER